MSTSEGKCVAVGVGALISWCIYSYRIVMLLVPYMWASMTFLPYMWASMTFWPKLVLSSRMMDGSDDFLLFNPSLRVTKMNFLFTLSLLVQTLK